MSSIFHLLLVDDDSLIAESMRLILPKSWKMTHVLGPQGLPQDGFFHAAFVDLHLSGNLDKSEGPDVLRTIKERWPSTEAVSISGDLNLTLMEECLAAGARQFLAKPLLVEEVRSTLEKIEALWQLREIEQRPQKERAQWIGRSKVSDSVREKVARLRGERGPILIEGETGTGKEVVAKLLHQQDPGRPFVPVNISSLPENLFESEFFGHVKGAFTGADSHKVGLAEAAQGGDLFLDEIEAFPLTQQVKLLRFLESGEIRRVGSKESQIVRCRVIAASNQKLQDLVKAGQFREDLYFRLRAHSLELPPLRDRREDVAEIAKYFLSAERPRVNKIFTPDALQVLTDYSWPGNVRELKRVCEQVALTSPLPMIRGEDLKVLLNPSEKTRSTDLSLGLAKLVQDFEAEIIRQALQKTQSVDSAAELLQVSRSSFYKKMKDYGIEGIS